MIALAFDCGREPTVAIVTARRAWVAAVGLVLALSLPARTASAANADEAREYLDKATAAFALNRYAVAAENFEKSFELKPDAAVLYNAAQAHRLGGNKERALSLYQSYLRTYGKKEKRAEIEARIEELKQAIKHDEKVANSPPVTTEPSSATQAEATAPPAATTVAASAAVHGPIASPNLSAVGPSESAPAALIASPASSPADDRSLVQKPWFWVAVGGGVVAAVVVVVLLASGGSKDPMPSIGVASGN